MTSFRCRSPSSKSVNESLISGKVFNKTSSGAETTGSMTKRCPSFRSDTSVPLSANSWGIPKICLSPLFNRETWKRFCISRLFGCASMLARRLACYFRAVWRGNKFGRLFARRGGLK